MKRIGRIAATTAATACLILVGAVDAHADDRGTGAEQAPTASQAQPADIDVCLSGTYTDQFEIFRLKGFDGGCWGTYGAQPSLAGLGWEYHSTALIDNSASAMTNNTASSWKMYDGAHYSGTAYVAKPWSADADLSSNSGNPSFDNKASSLQPL
jgi:hypothetical protein